MRDRVRSKNLKILLICPSNEYLSIHRKALKDCQYLRDIGGNPTLYCLKDSYVDKEANKHALPRLLFRGLAHSRFFKLSYFLDIRKVLKEDDWDIVHCYDFSFLWGVAFWLFGKTKIPLFLTSNQYLLGRNTNPFSHLLLRRVDSFFSFTNTSKNQTKFHFDLASKKMKMVGVGVEDYGSKQHKSEIHKIGCFIDKEDDFDNVRTLISAMTYFSKQSLQLNIYTHKEIKDYYRYTEIKKYIEEIGASSILKFIINENSKESLEEIDLFVNISFSEPICDYEIQSLLRGIPTISPRTASRQEIILEFPGILKTYYFQDARELRLCISSYLEHLETERSLLISYRDKLLAQQGLEVYAQEIQSSYEWAVAMRMRLNDSKQ
jgi:glycosyltransferase involved in cell wall biosynthesis